MNPAKTIAIIPARGGSKRIPGKNIRKFCGKPMIGYSIEAAQKSRLFDKIIVSTDDPTIAGLARHYGAKTPFKRPPKLSDDHTPTLPVIRHAIESIESQQNSMLTRVCCIYATAPFLDALHLAKGLDLLLSDDTLDFTFAATRYTFPIQRALYLDPKDHTVKMFQPENADARSQDLTEGFHDAGQFYWGRRDAFLHCENVFTARSAPVLFPREKVQDIDTPEDWDYAERLYKIQN